MTVYYTPLTQERDTVIIRNAVMPLPELTVPKTSITDAYESMLHDTYDLIRFAQLNLIRQCLPQLSNHEQERTTIKQRGQTNRPPELWWVSGYGIDQGWQRKATAIEVEVYNGLGTIAGAIVADKLESN